jgi:hypothetical protein
MQDVPSERRPPQQQAAPAQFGTEAEEWAIDLFPLLRARQ